MRILKGGVIIAAEGKITNRAYPLLTMLTGFVTFLFVGFITGLISLKTNEGLILILGLPLASMLMMLLLRKLSRQNILAVIIRSLVGGFAGLFAGFVIGELFNWIIAVIIPSLGDLAQAKSQILPNLFVLIVADAIFGAFLAGLFYGRKSISFFALTGAIASIPFGLLLSLPIDISWIKFDMNMFLMLVSFGATSGLSIGLYSVLKSKDIS